MTDPVLRLAMPAREPFPFAEERRLFYVALARARRSVTLITVRNRVSLFLVELHKDQGLRIMAAAGALDRDSLPAVRGRHYGATNGQARSVLRLFELPEVPADDEGGRGRGGRSGGGIIVGHRYAHGDLI